MNIFKNDKGEFNIVESHKIYGKWHTYEINNYGIRRKIHIDHILTKEECIQIIKECEKEERKENQRWLRKPKPYTPERYRAYMNLMDDVLKKGISHYILNEEFIRENKDSEDETVKDMLIDCEREQCEFLAWIRSDVFKDIFPKISADYIMKAINDALKEKENANNVNKGNE